MFTETQYLTERDYVIQRIKRMSANFYSEWTLRCLTTEELYRLEAELWNAITRYNKRKRELVASISNIENLLHALNSLTISLPFWPLEKDC